MTARTTFIERLAHGLGYHVSPCGLIVTSRHWHAMSQTPNRGGYLRFSFVLPTVKRRSLAVHRLQAYQKFGEEIYQSGIETRHKDGNQRNNAECNIVLGTPTQNAHDKLPEVRRRAALIAATSPKFYRQAEIIQFLKFHSVQCTLKEFGITESALNRYVRRFSPETTPPLLPA